MSTTMHRDQVASAHTAFRSPPGKTGYWNWLRKAAPTAIVLSALAGLALWGHSTDWTLPKFSKMIGGGAVELDNWCKEHGVPESQCIVCNTSLIARPTNYGWCKEHGVAQCPLEHPDVGQLNKEFSFTPDDLQRASRALALRPRAENNSRCLLHEKPIQLASLQTMEKLGMDIAVVVRRPVIEAVVANGEVTYDETQSARLASRVAGTIWRVEKQVGDRVEKGEILALIDSAEVGRAKSEFMQAIAQQRLKKKTADQMKPLASDGAIPGKTYREAEAALQESDIRLLGAQQVLVNLGFVAKASDYAAMSTEEIAKRLRLLGLPAEQVANLDGESTTSNLFPLRAPLRGVVVARDAVAGEVVDTSSTLFGVANVDRMWLTLDVRQDDAKYLQLGQTVLFQASRGHEESEIKGSLVWISTEADDRTRTIKVRANLPNPDGRLRANTFGTGRIVLREEPQAAVVPTEAVHSDGCCNIVFVRDKHFLKEGAPRFFHVRKVRVGVADGDVTEIIAGMLPGEVIASKNSVVLEAELMKSNLGAGCCEVHMTKK